MNQEENTINEEAKLAGLSKGWIEKFVILKSIGADEKFIFSATKGEQFKSLSFKQRHKINFNILAFLFGPLYYFAKKMWLKGTVIVGFVWFVTAILTAIELAINFTFPPFVYWIIPATICSQLATYDYFRHVMNDEKMWGFAPNFMSQPSGAIGFTVSSCLVLVLSTGILWQNNVPTCGSNEATGLVVDISEGELSKKIGDIAANSFDMAVSAIRTTETNEQTGAHLCAAQLDLYSAKGSNSIPITYSIETTDNGEEFYVSVYGL